MAKPRIVIAEDEAHLREILKFQLENAGFEVREASDGQAALELVENSMPDLVLLDVMMPRLDGYEVCRRLRGSFLTRHLPIVMLTAKGETSDKVTGLEGGANDYLTKPWKQQELTVRLKNVLEWSRQQRAASPLTGLPGNLSINEEIKRRLERGSAFALMQVDIDSFKAFNDQYGYTHGDVAIREVSQILIDAARHHGGDEAFVGHIGGDDFVVLTDPDKARTVGEDILARFNETVADLYSDEDAARGYVEVNNRRGEMERFPLMSLTIALVRTDLMPVTHLVELSDIAQELKAHGKGIPGSVIVGERRKTDSGGDARSAA